MSRVFTILYKLVLAKGGDALKVPVGLTESNVKVEPYTTECVL